MTNPLLTPFELPPFSKILPEHVVPAVTKALNDCRENVERVVAQGAPYTWENLCQPLAEVDDVLGRIFSPVSHLNSVKNSPELREAYEQTLPLLSEYSTWVGQHEGLYKAYRDLRDGDHYATLNTAQKKAVDNALRDFELSGIGLPNRETTTLRRDCHSSFRTGQPVQQQRPRCDDGLDQTRYRRSGAGGDA